MGPWLQNHGPTPSQFDSLEAPHQTDGGLRHVGEAAGREVPDNRNVRQARNIESRCFEDKAAIFGAQCHVTRQSDVETSAVEKCGTSLAHTDAETVSNSKQVVDSVIGWTEKQCAASSQHIRAKTMIAARSKHGCSGQLLHIRLHAGTGDVERIKEVLRVAHEAVIAFHGEQRTEVIAVACQKSAAKSSAVGKNKVVGALGDAGNAFHIHFRLEVLSESGHSQQGDSGQSAKDRLPLHNRKTLQVVDGYLVVTVNPAVMAMSLDLSILNFPVNFEETHLSASEKTIQRVTLKVNTTSTI